MLVTFIRKQRHEICLTLNCTFEFRFHVMKSMLISLAWISWNPLVTDLRADRMPKYFQASSLRSISLKFNDFIMHESWQKIEWINSKSHYHYYSLYSTHHSTYWENSVCYNKLISMSQVCIQLYTQHYIVTNH